MKHKALIFFFTTIISIAYSQNPQKMQEFSLGINKIHFWEAGHLWVPGMSFDSQTKYGFSIGYGIKWNIKKWPVKVGIAVENARGSAYITEYSGYNGEYIDIKVNDYYCNLLFDPVVVKMKYANLSLGGVMSIRIAQSGSSIHKTVTTLHDMTGKMVSYWDESPINTNVPVRLGIKGSFGIDFPISDNIIISPRYSLLYFFDPYFRNTSVNVLSIRRNLDIVLKFTHL